MYKIEDTDLTLHSTCIQFFICTIFWNICLAFNAKKTLLHITNSIYTVEMPWKRCVVLLDSSISFNLESDSLRICLFVPVYLYKTVYRVLAISITAHSCSLPIKFIEVLRVRAIILMLAKPFHAINYRILLDWYDKHVLLSNNSRQLGSFHWLCISLVHEFNATILNYIMALSWWQMNDLNVKWK